MTAAVAARTPRPRANASARKPHDAPEATPSRAAKAADSEKITINLGHVDLGQVDLLVSEGFYSNRTDFIRTAIRNQLTQHSDALKQVVARKMLVLGLQHISRQDLQTLQDARQKLTLRVVGLASIAADVTPELALDTIESLEVLGALHASAEVKRALAGRLK
ncbi:MAG: CopG family transcriptional regulator [Burkholderiaceae bacterium]|nr:CopG family transcriptional regulator [Burkholderiaceae bacterium]